MVVKWKFEDFIADDEYTFQINPNKGGSPELKKNIIQRNTTAPDGKTILFEGREEPQSMTFSGTLRDQAQLDDLQSWYQRSNQIRLTDDLGRSYSIYITGLTTTRIRAAQAPWKHEWEMTAVIVDWPS